MSYFLRLAGGTVYYGMTDKDGYTEAACGSTAEMVKISVGHDALIEIAKIRG